MEEKKIKQITLTLVKKNRVWFECQTSNNHKCKLKINEKTKDLELGTHDLYVENISIYSQYGSDIRYQVIDKIDEKIFLKADYNKKLTAMCQKLGGCWDHPQKVWVFPSFLQNEIEDLEEKYCSEKVNIELLAIKTIHSDRQPIDFLGYDIAIATSKNSGANLGKGVFQVCGEIGSSGSEKNWGTYISKDSVFRLSIPIKVLEDASSEEEYFSYKIIN